MKTIVSIKEGGDNIISVSPNNSEWGSIMLRNNEMGLNENGIIQEIKRVGFLNGPVETLQSIVEKYNLREGDDFSIKAFPVKILIQEGFDPIHDNHNPKINPRTGEIVTSGGKPVFRSTIVVPESSARNDVYQPTDRVATPVATPEKDVAFTDRQ